MISGFARTTGLARHESLELENGIQGNRTHFCLLTKLGKAKVLEKNFNFVCLDAILFNETVSFC